MAAAAFALGLTAGIVITPQMARQTTAANAAALVEQPLTDGWGLSRAAHPAQVLRVLDGDTFEAQVRIWPQLEVTTKIRLRGIDAPEFRARCAEERTKAEAARDALAALLAQGEVGVSHVKLDKYGGRVIASASTRKTADVSAALLQSGLVRAYSGGRRKSWC